MKILFVTMMSLAASSAFAAPKNRDICKVNSNSSFVGIKCEEKLTEHLNSIYFAECAFYADGDKTDWSQRNRFLGLKDDRLGTVKVGKHNTPLKDLSSPVDSFNNYISNKADITGIWY